MRGFRWNIYADRKHELYNTYLAMLHRVFNPWCTNYPHYGGRGITICERWLPKQDGSGFKNFVADVGKRPPGKYPDGRSLWSLDRINVNGNYEPGNVRWSRWNQQVQNRRKWKWGQSREAALRFFPGVVRNLVASPFAPHHYVDVAYQVRLTDRRTKVSRLVLLCSNHLNRSFNKREVKRELTGLAVQRSLCTLCRKEE